MIDKSSAFLTFAKRMIFYRKMEKLKESDMDYISKVFVQDMKSPFTGGRVFLVEKITKIKCRGEYYKIPVKDYLCEDTGIEFTTTELDEATINALYRQYCDRHHVKPLAENITDCY